ncbi:glutarate dioxygenase GlaH [Dasania marina]|uniref:glutarate dioxygenase GlaH n=1 Tax=Dasania marina TaxID=471499 RepID=UPI0030DAEFB7|tara:strand:- start:37025 stop:37981 length:957 start_codon:yes stop_codon:yes gene_type:complete
MNALAIQQPASVSPIGFTIAPYPASERLQVVTLSAATVKTFKSSCETLSVQAVEYKPFLRFALAEALDKITDYSLGAFLHATLRNRNTGGFLLEYEGQPTDAEQANLEGDFHVQLSTAISHMCGIPNHDAMYGKFYARFTVENKDNSDSYLRQAHRRMELHNDGTFVNEQTDFVLMMKMAEENMEGGDSLLLHLDDWQDLNKFYHHPLAKQAIQWGAPPSKNVTTKIHHPVFIDEDVNGNPQLSYIDQFAEPQNRAQGLYLHAMGESLENEKNCVNVRVKVGSMLVIQNYMWLHGRDKFVAHEGLRRELLRQRGHFTR